MAMDVGECERMIAACRAHRVTLGIAYDPHFYPIVARVRALLTAGEIGQSCPRADRRVRTVQSAAARRPLLVRPEVQAGGGPMFDFGCHRLELLLSLFGPCRR